MMFEQFPIPFEMWFWFFLPIFILAILVLLCHWGNE